MDADIKQMRDETTDEARFTIKNNRQLQELVQTAVKRDGGVRSKAKWLKDQCELYANRHNGNFGELFVAELDLVRWANLIHEAENDVA